MTETSHWAGPVFGEIGRLRDDGERVQCHACGEWFLHLGAHTFHTHGLRADDYRRVFGLMQKTKLGGPACLEMRRVKSADHLRTVDKPRIERVKRMSTEERRAEQANREWRREHELNKTEPGRIRHALRAKYGDEKGLPDAYVREVARLFVDELQNGQRGVYRRLGDRMGVGWSTARWRVMIAVDRGFLVWTGADHEPAGHLPGEELWHPPGSFDYMMVVLESRVAAVGDAAVPKSEVFEGERLGAWVQTLRARYRTGGLSSERVRRLEALTGWVWATR